MKFKVFGALALLLLAGCTASKPGAFEKVDEDPVANTVQYRFDPQKVNHQAMMNDLSTYCGQRGFDMAQPLPEQDSHLPGLKKIWYQCNYQIKS